MEKGYETKRQRLEADYWLFRARRDLILRLIQKIGAPAHNRVLDVGCGGGYLIKLLEKKGFRRVWGIDISDRAVFLCQKRGIKNVFVGDGIKTKFKEKMFDFVIADNVLEHIEDEGAALNEWRRILKENGRLIVLVPAFQGLWSPHDEICHHYRRYSQSVVIKALEKAFFEVERSSCWNLSLFFPASLVKIWQRFFPNKKRDQLYELSPFINGVLAGLLKLENWLLMRISFPLGLSVFGIAKKIKE